MFQTHMNGEDPDPPHYGHDGFTYPFQQSIAIDENRIKSKGHYLRPKITL